ncbi:hypothetical protein [Aliikangiella coralliicola]|uniref:HEAT repeat domain-containing protein n=1 Tax=Aliikangiella coralliicola TaxID=2592383 RepID=A0A545U7A0_9GAMM|nr:hypothetical protein [Aliikangiella coralliicola]TQV85330.1 hypothetical protein FLL46_19380 [Aliikangiella coralliicola]
MKIRKHFLLVGLFLCVGASSIAHANVENYRLIPPDSLNQQVNQTKQLLLFQKIQQATSPLELAQQIVRSKSLSTVNKEYLLFELAKNLRITNLQIKQANKQSALSYIKSLKPQLKTVLSDGNHQQVIIAFPFDKAAEASQEYLKLSQLAEKVTTLIQQADYATLSLQNEFLSLDKKQTQLTKKIIGQLSQQQAEYFVDWSLERSDINLESKLIFALKAKNKNVVLNLLQDKKSIPLHRYLQAVINLWSKSQQLSAIASISKNENYASQMMYLVNDLNIPREQKINFWISQLDKSTSGASAAHSLAKIMNNDLADNLAQKSIETQSQSFQSRALLALNLSKQDYAKEKIKMLLEDGLVSANLAKEVSKWLN